MGRKGVCSSNSRLCQREQLRQGYRVCRYTTYDAPGYTTSTIVGWMYVPSFWPTAFIWAPSHHNCCIGENVYLRRGDASVLSRTEQCVITLIKYLHPQECSNFGECLHWPWKLNSSRQYQRFSEGTESDLNCAISGLIFKVGSAPPRRYTPIVSKPSSAGRRQHSHASKEITGNRRTLKPMLPSACILVMSMFNAQQFFSRLQQHRTSTL